MDSLMSDDFNDSDGFSPEAPAKAKAAPKKAAVAKAKAPKKASVPKEAATKKTKAAPKKKAKVDTEDENSDSELDALLRDDDSNMNTTPPSAKKSKKPASKKAAGGPLEDITNLDGPADKKAPNGNASLQYEKLSQYEHVLKRPDTYIGSVERTTKTLWVYNSESNSMESRPVTYVPGLYKIFDEILVNAADNKQRDMSMNMIKVTVDRAAGEISVMNNGRGIPIEIHNKWGKYIPEMIFGELLTSSNYDDATLKVVGGRNGYGAKLANIFSTEFILETADAVNQKKYKQTWTDNMSAKGKGKAKITENKKGDNYTKVTFKPDFAKFGMEGMDDDFEALVKRRVHDVAGTCSGVKVFLNNERIKVDGFKKYMEMYGKAISQERMVNPDHEAANFNVITENVHNERWEIGFGVSDGSFQQVSFVNSIATTSGGTHVNYIADQIVARLVKQVEKTNKKGYVPKPHQIRNHIFIFVNCLIENPAFTSQTKEQLTTKISQFGSKHVVSDSFLAKILKTEVLSNINAFAQIKADQALSKGDGGRRTRMDNPKLTDANKAGAKDGHKCTLILTEGDSAKGLAMAGRAVVSADQFGVFPLRGKLLNVRDASIEQIAKNAEIQAIKKIMGLQHGKTYDKLQGLRYGQIMIMTDQDHDGSHIKGLLINFFHHAFPSLLAIPRFLVEFVTPIVKVYKGNPAHPQKVQTFFSMPEYEKWKEIHQAERGWEHKYYKGLGTSSTSEAQGYFRDVDRHLKEFDTIRPGDDKLIELAFGKKKADERKEWLRQYKPGTHLDSTLSVISYDDFINKELILFSIADCARSIPSMIDGLKPGQRKVLHACFKRNLVKDKKVVELAGHVSGTTAYQHGEQSLQQTIVAMAQTFVGSSNVNYLEPSGNFGSRLQGGGDCASARYIYTRLSPFAKKVINPADGPLLTYNTDDNVKIEPEIFYPIMPMILVNGAEGIGTGWSTSIPNYNPEDIVKNLMLMMNDEEPVAMVPWYRGWKGTVTNMPDGKYKFTGKIRIAGPKEVEISELPVKTWTQDFKDKLEEIIKAEKMPSFIKDYADYNTHEKVNFLIQMDEATLTKIGADGLEEKFKLSKMIGNGNMVAFDEAGRLKKYSSVLDIMRAFYDARLVMYQKRRAHQLAELQKVLDKLSNQARFVKMIIEGKLVVSKKKKSVLVTELKAKGFKAIPKIVEATKEGETEPALEDGGEEEVGEDVQASANDYDYLLGMAIWSLTQERVDKLLRNMGETEEEITILTGLTPKNLWKKDLDDFLEEWQHQLQEEETRQAKQAKLGRRASTKLRGAAAKKRKAAGEDPEDSDFETAKPKKTKTTKTAFVKKEAPKSNAFAYLKAGSDKPKAVQAKAKASMAMVIDGASDPVDSPSDVEIIEGEPKAGARAGRAAAKKTVNYGGTSESETDDGDDMLGDVSKMVKGIGNAGATETASASRPLFSSSLSRPGSSAGLPKPNKTKRVTDITDDETDFSKLIPTSSPRKSLSTVFRPATLPEDEESDSPVAAPVLSKPTKANSKSAAGKAAPKAAVSGKGKQAAAKKGSAAPSKVLSKGRGGKKAQDHEDAFDVPDSDDNGDVRMSDAPPVARPARRAAAAKRKPIVIEDSEESEADQDSDDF
ncbi:MAG: DNA topoisomerase 2 [Vezdaea aestivalis]|nr:MAG: DNA topoisomerase 2 [Vezdaea aestivalis]